ncbi:MAG: 5-formyltetrahydrofolate cyclo-ligase [Chloroflexaceae bacterium]|nr:5-formyltetrahydrofolate cyclo-ligase [Chloroflexaceae bacterium]
MDTVYQKTTLRRTMRRRREKLDRRDTRSRMILERITGLSEYQAATVIHTYLTMGSEVDTSPLLADALERGKRVVVPIVQAHTNNMTHSWLTSLNLEEREVGLLGTPQPRVLMNAPDGVWNLVFVPLLAFDRWGYRLGYGKGFYDQFLRRFPCTAVGLAFAMQEVPTVPHEAHDVRLDWVVTEEETIVTRSAHDAMVRRS